MKSQDVVSILRRFLTGDRDQAVKEIRCLAANETAANRHAVGNELQQLLRLSDGHTGLMMLPKSCDGVACYEPRRGLQDLICYEHIEVALRRFIMEWNHRQMFLEKMIPVNSSILLRGPSGCGKTMAAECIAHELQLPLAVISHGKTIDSHVGESAKKIEATCQWAAANPCVLLFDECDSFLGQRYGDANSAAREAGRMVNCLLQMMDRTLKNVPVMFATNFGSMLDSAFNRRVGVQIDFPEPDSDSRRELVTRLCFKLVENGVDVKGIATNNDLLEFGSLAEVEDRAYAMVRKLMLHAVT